MSKSRATMPAKKSAGIGKEVEPAGEARQLTWLENQSEIIKDLKALLEVRAEEIQELQADIADKNDELAEQDAEFKE